MAKRNALGKLYTLAWRHKSPRVRRAALFLLVKGKAILDPDRDEEVVNELVDAGCCFNYMFVPNHGYMDVFKCPGAKECYPNGAFFE